LKIDIFNTDKKYQIIYADPPWSYDSRTISGTHKGNPDDHYDTMKLIDICKLPIKSITNNDCILFLWTTYPKLKEAFQVMEAWGFEYKSIGFQWIKQNKINNDFFLGLGRWTRGNTEPCLIATKGKPKKVSSSVRQIILSHLEEHSKKPKEARDRIVDLMGDIPRIELFARQYADGWDCWGNEV